MLKFILSIIILMVAVSINLVLGVLVLLYMVYKLFNPTNEQVKPTAETIEKEKSTPIQKLFNKVILYIGGTAVVIFVFLIAIGFYKYDTMTSTSKNTTTQQTEQEKRNQPYFAKTEKPKDTIQHPKQKYDPPYKDLYEWDNFVENELLAEQGNADAQANLGIMYRQAHEYEQSYWWYQKAVQQGNARGQFGLGVLYYYGQGVPQDYTQALYYFKKSALQGNEQGQAMFGAMHYNGQGVIQNKKTACLWFTLSAKQGYEPAIGYLATHCN